MLLGDARRRERETFCYKTSNKRTGGSEARCTEHPERRIIAMPFAIHEI
jgi:hypothetical protein